MGFSRNMILGLGFTLGFCGLALAQSDDAPKGPITDQTTCEAEAGTWVPRADGEYCIVDIVSEEAKDDGAKGVTDCPGDVMPTEKENVSFCWYPVKVIELKTEIFKDADGNIIENPEELLGSGATEVVVREISEDEIPEGAKVIELSPEEAAEKLKELDAAGE